MFLHIGENNLIKKKDIIGVFNIDILKENKDLYTGKIDDEKSLLIIQSNKNTETILSNVSVSTIKKRMSAPMKI